MNSPPSAQHSRPLWLAALLTALLTPALYLLGFTLIALAGGNYSSELAARSVGVMFLFGLLPALGAMFFVGLPLVLLLESQRLLTLWYVLAGAVAVGMLTMIVLVTIVMQSPFVPLVLVWGTGLGAFAGVIFCIAAGIPFSGATNMMVGALLGIAGLIYLVLGALHAVFTLLDERNPRRLAPDDPAVFTAMQNSKMRLSRGAMTMWQAWISFNLTHSLAAILMGTACLIVTAHLGLFVFSPWALFALAGVSGLFALIGLRYWFGVPRAGALIATAALTAAWLLYAL